jgi:hypothetical protein
MKNKCNICGTKNHQDNFNCSNVECGAPLDLVIETNSFGLPEIKEKFSWNENWDYNI